jgi:ribonuclease HI
MVDTNHDGMGTFTPTTQSPSFVALNLAHVNHRRAYANSHITLCRSDSDNNTTEYEGLLLGVRMEKDKNIKVLKVFGYFDLVVQQITNQCSAKNERLKSYHNAIRDYIDFLLLLCLESKNLNSITDLMDVSTSKLQPRHFKGVKMEVVLDL